MNRPSHDEMNEFINALQLSINSQISSWFIRQDQIEIHFLNREPNDVNLESFQKLVPGIWKPSGKTGGEIFYIIANTEFVSSLSTQFLLLTRLNKENVLTLAELDKKYKPFADKIYGPSDKKIPALIDNTEDVSRIIFDEVQRQKLTLRQLAEKTTLSPVSLSNFKAGKDIRLSNLIKICQTLKLKISIGKS